MSVLFSLIIGLGAALGLALVAQRAPEKKLSIWMNAGLWTLFGALLGARGVFVAVNWDYFQAHLIEIPQIWLGGLSWPGAVSGALITLAFIALVRKEALGGLADGVLPMGLPLIVAIWLASWEAGTGYGAIAPNTWWATPAVDEWGAWLPRWPLQPLGALATLVIFLAIDRLHPRLKQPGELSSLAFVGIAMTTFGLSFFRADPGQFWRGWRLDTWAALAFMGLAVIFCVVAFWPRRKKVNLSV